MAYSLKHINELAKNDPKAFVEGTEAEFQRKLELAAKRIAGNRDKSHIILLSGPSGSGKTTTAMKIEKLLDESGVETHTISMDNYFNTIDPETAPVPGRGMATSSTSPSVRYFRTFRPFKCARRSRRSTFGPSHALFRIRANTRRSSSKIQGTGVRFPAIAVTAATAGGSPAATPSGMAPRSSTTGTIAIKKVIASFPNTLSPKIM